MDPYLPHNSLIDYIAISGTMERNVLEFVDHLHEHFLYPCSINQNGRYNVPDKANEGYRYFSPWRRPHRAPCRATEADAYLASRCTSQALQSTSSRKGRTGRASAGREPRTDSRGMHRSNATIPLRTQHIATPSRQEGPRKAVLRRRDGTMDDGS